MKSFLEGLYKEDVYDNIRTLKKLYLNNNNIIDISALKDFTSFDDLNTTGSPITNYEVIDHIKNVVK